MRPHGACHPVAPSKGVGRRSGQPSTCEVYRSGAARAQLRLTKLHEKAVEEAERDSSGQGHEIQWTARESMSVSARDTYVSIRIVLAGHAAVIAGRGSGRASQASPSDSSRLALGIAAGPRLPRHVSPFPAHLPRRPAASCPRAELELPFLGPTAPGDHVGRA